MAYDYVVRSIIFTSPWINLDFQFDFLPTNSAGLFFMVSLLHGFASRFARLASGEKGATKEM
jgi:hypothetical protein